jgi:hypothetical protein
MSDQPRCEICLEDLAKVKRMHASLLCGHVFCKKCLSTHLTYEAESGKDFDCPIPGCNTVIDPTGYVTKAILGRRLRAQREKLSMFEMQAKIREEEAERARAMQAYQAEVAQHEAEMNDLNTTNGEIKKLQKVRAKFADKCPKESCKGRIIEGVCNTCMTEVCPDCKEIKHEGPCNKDITESVDEIDKVTKPCIGCRAPILKDGGCDHMTCRFCGTEFWWSTGELFKLGKRLRAPPRRPSATRAPGKPTAPLPALMPKVGFPSETKSAPPTESSLRSEGGPSADIDPLAMLQDEL